MAFFNAAILWALPFGLTPIIIYYLMRYRSLKVVWGAEYVLRRALDRLKKKLFLDQVLLLAVRVLACVVLVAAFARPVSHAKSGTVSGGGVHRVLVVDGSYSMLAGEANQTRWDRAKAAMTSLVSTWGRGEKWSLYFLDETPRWVAQRAAVETPEAVAAAIGELRTGECRASLAKALEEAAAKFPEDALEIYVFADDQALTWKGAEDLAWPGGTPPPIYWVNPPLESGRNLAVKSVAFGSEKVLAGHPCRAFVTVRNFGPEAAKDVPVELLVDGAFFGKEAVSLLPGQEGEVRFDVVFDGAGPHRATARLAKDALAFDNEMSAGVEAAGKLKVVALRGAGKQGKFDSAWPFLQIVGRVEAMKDEDGKPVFAMGPIEFSSCAEKGEAEALAAADVAVLDGSRAVTAELADRLRGFVARGGGVVLAADENVDDKAWNAHLASAGLLPAPLKRLRVETLGGEQYQTFSRTEFDGNALKAFETGEDGDLAAARFFTWFEIEKVSEGSEVLYRFADRQPYLVRLRKDVGEVLLLASGLNGRGNNLVAREFCVPFLFRLFSEAAAGGTHPRTVRRGEPIRLRLRDAAGLRAATFQAEGREPVPLQAAERGGEATLSMPGGSPTTGMCSILLVREDGTQRVWFGVQGERVDSDLTPLADDVRRALTSRLGAIEVKDWVELDEILQSSRRGSEWHHWVILGLLAALAVEMLLQRRFV